MPEGDKKKIKIVDDRKVSAATGGPLKLSRTGDYDEDVVRHIALAAIRAGNDPMTALAIGMQESGLGTATTENGQSNWGQVNLSKWGNNPELLAEIEKNKDLNPHAVAMNYVLKKNMVDNKDPDEARMIQGYNGYLLKPNNDIGATKMYGIDLTKYPKGYDLKKDPRYGRSVIDIRDGVLKKNKSMVDYVNSLNKPPIPDELSGITVAVADSPNGRKRLSFMKDNAVIKEADVDANEYNNSQDRGQILRSALGAGNGQALKSVFPKK